MFCLRRQKITRQILLYCYPGAKVNLSTDTPLSFSQEGFCVVLEFYLNTATETADHKNVLCFFKLLFIENNIYI